MQQAGAIVLVERGLLRASGSGTASDAAPPLQLALQLPLCADQRSSLRGLRRSACGQDLLLQLPRGAALRPGELLGSSAGDVVVEVVAAPEPVMAVRSASPLALLQAAYHLGNRHVAMELHADRLVLLQDSVLAELLRQRGLQVELLNAAFLPEAGAYEGIRHAHGHAHAHSHDH